jgi:cobalt-zinc-cadmium efflux system protein
MSQQGFTENFQAVISKNRRNLFVVFFLTLIFFLVELSVGFITNSLTLLSDAAHAFTDLAAIALSLLAIWISQKPPTKEKTFGYYRVEILTALINITLLVVTAIFIFINAYSRLHNPPPISGIPLILVALLGMLIKGTNTSILWKNRDTNLNVKAIYLDVLTDLLGLAAVILSGIIMTFTKWYNADPIFGAVIGIIILFRTWQLLSQSVNILLEAAPAHIDCTLVEKGILDIPGVEAVHDLHVWTIASGIESLTAHIVLKTGFNPYDSSAVLDKISSCLKDQFGIHHSTLQVEPTSLQEREISH